MEHPLELYSQFAAIPSVTYCESRIYHSLLAHWNQVRRAYKASASALSIDFVDGRQLMVNWTGSKKSRRMAVVVHTDREGYIIDKAVESRESDSDRVLVAEGFLTNHSSIEAGRQDTQVVVAAGVGGAVDTYEGRIRAVNYQGSPGRVLVEIRVHGRQDGQKLKNVIEKTDVAVSAHHEFGPPIRINTETGQISAGCVDNFAGVAVATSFLMETVKHSLPVNASVLYTTCEEGGLLGILDLARCGSHVLKTPPDNLLWIVLDGSNVEYSFAMGLDEWRELRVTQKDDSMYHGGDTRFSRCPMNSVAIRLEDRITLYDVSAAVLLYQAALNARASRARSRKSTEVDSTLKDWIRDDALGTTGMFQGGYCEATVLNLLPCLWEKLHGETVAQPRCGALAIPLLNYRNLLKDGLAPEECHCGALMSAREVLLAASRLNNSCFYMEQLKPRYRGSPPLTGYPPSTEDLVESFIKRLDNNSALMNGLRRWIADEGQAMIQSSIL